MSIFAGDDYNLLDCDSSIQVEACFLSATLDKKLRQLELTDCDNSIQAVAFF